MLLKITNLHCPFFLAAIRVSSPPPRLGKNSRVEFNVAWKTRGIRIEGNKNSVRHNLAFLKSPIDRQRRGNDDDDEDDDETDDDDGDDNGDKGKSFDDEGCLICVMKYAADGG